MLLRRRFNRFFTLTEERPDERNCTNSTWPMHSPSWRSTRSGPQLPPRWRSSSRPCRPARRRAGDRGEDRAAAGRRAGRERQGGRGRGRAAARIAKANAARDEKLAALGAEQLTQEASGEATAQADALRAEIASLEAKAATNRETLAAVRI